MRRRLAIGVTALVALGGAAIIATYLAFFAGGQDRTADLTPADASAYVTVHLEPSSGQQMNLAGLLGRLPGFADAATLDAKIDELVHGMLASVGIDYRADVKPWLGGQAALALVAGEGGAREPVLIVEVRDADAAAAALPELVGGGGPGEPYGSATITSGERGAFALVDGRAAIGASADAVRAVVDVADGAPALADSSAFADAMRDLPSDHLAAVYVTASDLTDGARDDAEPSRLAAVLVAEAERLRLHGMATVAGDTALPTRSPGPSAAARPDSTVVGEWIPADTVVAAEVFGVGDVLAQVETALSGTDAGEQLGATLETAEGVAALGLGTDLRSLLEADAAIGIRSMAGSVPSGQLVLRPYDPAVADRAADAFVQLIPIVGGSTTTSRVGEVEVTTAVVQGFPSFAFATPDGVLIVGFSEADVAAAINAQESGETLGRTADFQRALEGLSGAPAVSVYAGPEAVPALLGSAATLSGDTRDILAAIGGLGVTVEPNDTAIHLQAALVLDEADAE